MSDYNIMLYDTMTKSAQTGGLESLDEWEARPGSWVWVNISGVADETEFKLLN